MSDIQFIVSTIIDCTLIIAITILAICLVKFVKHETRIKYFTLQKGLDEKDLEPHTKTLTKRQKQIIRMYYCECKQIGEIAEKLNLSIESVNKEKKQAVDKILKNCN